MFLLYFFLIKVGDKPFGGGHPRFMRNTSFLPYQLFYSIGSNDGSDQVSLVGPGVLLLHSLLSPVRIILLCT